MRRFFRILLISLAAVAVLSGCSSSNRDSVLKVYNWSDYIDEDLLDVFEQWYKDCTGEDIKVIYQTFDINETMLSKIEKGHEDYDVVCPSDYAIEKMLAQDLLLPIGDLDTVLAPGVPNYMKETLSPFIKETFDYINAGPGRNANDYAIAYMWGTTGILYNDMYVTEEEASTWATLLDPKFKNKILMKDAARDVFSQVVIYLNRDKIAAGEVDIKDLMVDCSPETIASVEDFLAQMKDNVYGWEADFGKEQMVQERGYLSLNWSGDAVWAIEEAADEGYDHLRYAIPQEGFTYWFDGWVIPKYAKNLKAAKYWIDFMCNPENAIRNMDATGYVSANGDPSVLESQEDEELDPIDVSYFFGPGYDSVRVDPALYCPGELIAKSTFEHDWGENTYLLTEFWARVKGNNANTYTYVVITLFLIGLITAVVYSRTKNLRRRARHKARAKAKKAAALASKK